MIPLKPDEIPSLPDLRGGASTTALSTSAEPALTIYNQNFAVVRERVPLDLKAGLNTVACSGVTMHLEPDSVVLRDPPARSRLRVLEQSYRADTISQGLMLSLNEGKTLDFIAHDRDNRSTSSRAGDPQRLRPNFAGGLRFGQQYYQQQQRWESGGRRQPIIEVDGKLRFSLRRAGVPRAHGRRHPQAPAHLAAGRRAAAKLTPSSATSPGACAGSLLQSDRAGEGRHPRHHRLVTIDNQSEDFARRRSSSCG